MNESVQVTDSAEIAAVKSGAIEGYLYEDGEVWAQAESLERWRRQHEGAK